MGTTPKTSLESAPQVLIEYAFSIKAWSSQDELAQHMSVPFVLTNVKDSVAFRVHNIVVGKATAKFSAIDKITKTLPVSTFLMTPSRSVPSLNFRVSANDAGAMISNPRAITIARTTIRVRIAPPFCKAEPRWLVHNACQISNEPPNTRNVKCDQSGKRLNAPKKTKNLD